MLRSFLTYATVIVVILSFPISAVEGKRKRAVGPPPLKILDISTSPVPFAPGRGPLAMTIEVELPKNLNGPHMLEVSSLISFSTKRSVRFLYNRQPVSVPPDQTGKARVTTTLLWDGMDQTKKFVVAGKYDYEVRAKLFAIGADGPRTRMVSLRARGTLEVAPPQEVTP